MPASRKARQMTFTPRSCPSRPTLPINTRMRPALVDGVFDIPSPFLHKRVDDLATAGIRPHRLDGLRHQVGVGIPGDVPQAAERSSDGSVVAFDPNLLQLGNLPLLYVGLDRVQ